MVNHSSECNNHNKECDTHNKTNDYHKQNGRPQVAPTFCPKTYHTTYIPVANSYSCHYIKTTAQPTAVCCSFFQNQHFIQFNALTIMQLYHIIKMYHIISCCLFHDIYDRHCTISMIKSMISTNHTPTLCKKCLKFWGKWLFLLQKISACGIIIECGVMYPQNWRKTAFLLKRFRRYSK